MMPSVAEVMTEIAQRQWDNLAPWDHECVNDVLEAASEWEAGSLPLPEFAKIGAITSPTGFVSPAYSRYVAVISTQPDDPRRTALLRAIDRLLIYEGLHLTKHGIFSPQDVAEVGASVSGSYTP